MRSRHFLLALLALSSPALADTVFLKDGRRLEGTVSESGDELAIKGKLGTVKVKRDDVDHIEAAAPEPEPEPVEPKKPAVPAPTKQLSGPERSMLEVASRELADGKAVEGLKTLGPLMAGVSLYDWNGQRTLRLLASRLHLRAGHHDDAVREATAFAEIAPERSRHADAFRARLIDSSPDGTFLIQAEDLAAHGSPEIPEGPQPLWNDKVLAFALRLEAAREEVKGLEKLEEARGLEKKDKAAALASYRAAEASYSRAEDLSPGCCRPKQLAAIRGLLTTLLDLAIEADEKQMASSPLNVGFEMLKDPKGRYRFTPAGRSKFDQTRAAWNMQVERLESFAKDLEDVKKRFPEEAAAQKGNYDRIRVALTDMVPKIRAAFAKQLADHN